MIRQKPRNFKKLTWGVSFVLGLGLFVVVGLIVSPQSATAATATDCSDVYTPLSSDVVNGVNANEADYKNAMNATGVPWEMFAAIHYRETGFSHTNPGNGQGLFQDGNSSNGVSLAPGPVSESNFYQQLLNLGHELQSDYVWRGSVPRERRQLQPGESNMTIVMDTLMSYNGRATSYANQAATYGYSSTNQPYEGSPYVMNRFDCQRARMGIITQDGGAITGTDTRYGAFTIFARLRGDDFWKSLQSPFTWQDVGVKIMDEGQHAEIPTDYMHPGERLYVQVSAQNTGQATWWQNGNNPARLGTLLPYDHMTTYCDSTWPMCNRTGGLEESSVPPGQIGHFDFYMAVPNNVGAFREYFKPVLEYQSWMTNDTGFNIYVNDTNQYNWQWLYFDAYTDQTKSTPVDMDNLAANQQVYIVLHTKNQSATMWSNTGANPTRLGTANNQDRMSSLCTVSWVSCNRPATMDQTSVAPGGEATFSFTIKAPSVQGVDREYFKPVLEYKGWTRDDSNYIYLDVTH